MTWRTCTSAGPPESFDSTVWADGSGADVMKRIAAPMVGGLVTSAFLTLEIIPVVYTYWRNEQRVWRLLKASDAQARDRLEALARTVTVALAVAVGALVARLYLDPVPGALAAVSPVAGAVAIASLMGYVLVRWVSYTPENS